MAEAQDWLQLAGIALVYALLLVSVFTDLAKGMIYNWLTVPVMILGLLLAGLRFGGDGLMSAGLGLLAGGVILLVPFLLGAVGGGDVKLLAALGCLIGPLLILKTALYACLLGGVAAVVLLAGKGLLLKGMKDVGRFFAALLTPGQSPAPPAPSGLAPLPFALCIAGGFIWANYFDVLPRLLG